MTLIQRLQENLVSFFIIALMGFLVVCAVPFWLIGYLRFKWFRL